MRHTLLSHLCKYSLKTYPYTSNHSILRSASSFHKMDSIENAKKIAACKAIDDHITVLFIIMANSFSKILAKYLTYLISALLHFLLLSNLLEAHRILLVYNCLKEDTGQ